MLRKKCKGSYMFRANVKTHKGIVMKILHMETVNKVHITYHQKFQRNNC